jgi:hypothetical protein
MTALTSTTLAILLVSFYYTSSAFSFAPSSVTMTSNQLRRSHIIEATILRANSDDDDDGNSDDDEVMLSESEDDWRTFRAKLVMGESTAPSSTATSSSSTTSSGHDTIIIDDTDLDGIGALFSSETAQSTISSTSKFTPLDPSQWAMIPEKLSNKAL